jgi:hypothetical protein
VVQSSRVKNSKNKKPEITQSNVEFKPGVDFSVTAVSIRQFRFQIKGGGGVLKTGVLFALQGTMCVLELGINGGRQNIMTIRTVAFRRFGNQ